jgi:hypothetical protein
MRQGLGALSGLEELLRASRPELEEIYASRPMGPTPGGRFRGVFLCFLDNDGAARPSTRAIDSLLFRAVPFGVDFGSRRWWFVDPRVQAGRFDAEAGPSRWRDTDTLRLRYGASRLPGPIRSYLYDEVKPLSEDLCLGIGGVDAERGEGDHFFFALSAI